VTQRQVDAWRRGSEPTPCYLLPPSLCGGLASMTKRWRCNVWKERRQQIPTFIHGDRAHLICFFFVTTKVNSCYRQKYSPWGRPVTPMSKTQRVTTNPVRVTSLKLGSTHQSVRTSSQRDSVSVVGSDHYSNVPRRCPVPRAARWPIRPRVSPSKV
jgi:hypothetical protein